MTPWPHVAEHRVARDSEIGEGTVRTVTAGDRLVALGRMNGALFALDNACPHAGGPLGEGVIEPNGLRCPWHERHFDPQTGACVDQARTTKPVACYAVRVENGAVLVETS